MKTFDIIKKRVACGLQLMKLKPVAFVYSQFHSESNFTWDEKTIFDFPVYHAENIKNLRADTISSDCPFIPLFKEDSPDILISEKEFYDGYDMFDSERLEKDG